jgi:hypothetical protein
MSQEGTKNSETRHSDLNISPAGAYYNHEEKNNNNKNNNNKTKTKKYKNKKTNEKKPQTSLDSYRTGETSLGSYRNREEPKKIFFDIFETQKNSRNKREIGTSQKRADTRIDPANAGSDPSKELESEKSEEETKNTDGDTSSDPSLLDENAGYTSDSSDEDGVPSCQNRCDSDNITSYSPTSNDTNSQSDSEPVQARMTHPRSSKKANPHPMIEILFLTATSEEDDEDDEDGAGSDRQDKTPAVAPSNLVDPAAALASIEGQDKEDNKTALNDPAINTDALDGIPPPYPHEANHTKYEPPTPEAMSKSHSPLMTDYN